MKELNLDLHKETFDRLTKEGYFYIGPYQQWQADKYGECFYGAFDVIYNTCRKIIDDNDKSDWAYDAVFECANLLRARIRYPDKWVTKNVAKNRIDEWWSIKMYNCRYKDRDWFKKLFKQDTGKYVKIGPNTKLTRDPYVYLYAACVHLNILQFIEVIQPPWYLFRPSLWVWRKYILHRTKFWQWAYEVTELSQLWMVKKDYALLMVYYRACAVYNRRIIEKLITT